MPPVKNAPIHEYHHGRVFPIMTKSPDLLLTWESWTIRGLLTAILVAAASAIFVKHLKQRRREREQADSFLKRLVDEQQIERTRIAQALHDRIGQELLLVKNAALQGLVQPSSVEITRVQFSQISKLASAALEEAQTMAYRLRPFELECLGFDKSLEIMIDRLSETPGIRVFRDLDSLDEQVPSDIQLYLYRVIQAGLDNVTQHSRASTVLVEVKSEEGRIRIEIEDNGIGSESANGLQLETAGHELLMMEKRTKLLGGEFEKISTPGKGTRIHIILPSIMTP